MSSNEESDAGDKDDGIDRNEIDVSCDDVDAIFGVAAVEAAKTIDEGSRDFHGLLLPRQGSQILACTVSMDDQRLEQVMKIGCWVANVFGSQSTFHLRKIRNIL